MYPSYSVCYDQPLLQSIFRIPDGYQNAQLRVRMSDWRTGGLADFYSHNSAYQPHTAMRLYSHVNTLSILYQISLFINPSHHHENPLYRRVRFYRRRSSSSMPSSSTSYFNRMLCAPLAPIRRFKQPKTPNCHDQRLFCLARRCPTPSC